MAVTRTTLSFAVLGRQKTYVFRVKYRGSWLNLDSPVEYSVLAKGVKPDGSSFLTPIVTIPTQTGADVGVLLVTFSTTDLSVAGTYKLDIYIGTAGAEEPLEYRYDFEVQAKETEA